uniref:hypothetical protein n=1 Tax=Salmonella sp. s39606 TaxID=3159643 RepID=UPI00397F89A6
PAFADTRQLETKKDNKNITVLFASPWHQPYKSWRRAGADSITKQETHQGNQNRTTARPLKKGHKATNPNLDQKLAEDSLNMEQPVAAKSSRSNRKEPVYYTQT